MKVLHLVSYSQPCGGNFIASMRGLSKTVREHGGISLFVFPSKAAIQPWFLAFAQEYQVFLVNDMGIGCRKVLLDILLSEKPTIVHSHFDTFDVPLSLACRAYRRRTGHEIHQIWHLHNQKGYNQHGLHKIYWKLRFAIHYGFFSKDVSIISVSEEMHRFVTKYHHFVWHSDIGNIQVIPNGIELSRCGERSSYEPHLPFVFLAFGRSVAQKRTDLLVRAAQVLVARGYDLKVRITRGDADQSLLATLGDIRSCPQWLEFIDPEEQISRLFEQSDCFVSTSVHETFSYAVCEASVYGLPVIQSDIEGTQWNNDNPSTFVFPSLDADRLVECMEQVMLADTEKMKLQCESTRQNNRNRFPLEKWCQDVMQFYTKVLKPIV